MSYAGGLGKRSVRQFKARADSRRNSAVSHKPKTADPAKTIEAAARHRWTPTTELPLGAGAHAGDRGRLFTDVLGRRRGSRAIASSHRYPIDERKGVYDLLQPTNTNINLVVRKILYPV